MPVQTSVPLRVFDQDRFASISFEVMKHVFAIHNEMGRFFDESVYRNALKHRLGDRAETEVCIHVTFDDFRKPYRIDLLVDRGALFELKTAQHLHQQHRNQVINYLMLTGLQHGKLVNCRPEKIQHEFVNCLVKPEDRRTFGVYADRWDGTVPECSRLQELLVAVLRDWGTGLELRLYEEVVTHFFGGDECVQRDVEVRLEGCRLGRQTARLINPKTAFKLTSLHRNLSAFETHAKRFLEHTGLDYLAWVNISLWEVTFVLVRR